MAAFTKYKKSLHKLFTIISLLITLNISSQTWLPYFGDSLWNQSGSNPQIFDFQIINNQLYIGGAFGYVNNNELGGIAKWNDTTWIDLNHGSTMAGIFCIDNFNNEIYVGGDFWDIGGKWIRYFAKFSGTNWDTVGNIGTPNSKVITLKYKQELYFGGVFNQIGTTNYKAIASWNDTAYNNVKGGLIGGYMECDAMCIYNDMLVVGGNFTKAGTTPALSIAMWDGTNFYNLGQGVSSFVWGLVTDTINNFLYVGGADMYWAGGLTVNNIAMWDGYNWNKVGNGITFYGETLCMYRGELYAGSNLTSNEETQHFISRWDGLSWDSVGTGFNGFPKAMLVYNDELLVGGKINYINDTIRSPGFARWHLPYTYNCNALQPRIHTLADTVYLNNGSVNVQFYNNNAYSPYWQWSFGDSATDSIQNPLHTYTDTGTYTVSLTVAHESCVKTATKQITVRNPVGISSFNIQNSTFNIYPNPTNNQFTIETTITQGSKGVIKIYNIKGELKTEKTIETQLQTSNLNRACELNEVKPQTVQLDVSDWEKGTYICVLEQEGKQVESKKFVVQ